MYRLEGQAKMNSQLSTSVGSAHRKHSHSKAKVSDRNFLSLTPLSDLILGWGVQLLWHRLLIKHEN